MNNAIHIIRDKSAGFTLVEIMIVIAIIALLAAIAVPNFQRARKRGQAVRILNDLRIIDYAIDRWAIEHNKTGSEVATFSDIKPYLKAGTQLYDSGTDVFGNAYGPSFTVDTGPKITTESFNTLSDVAPEEFWSPFK